VSGSVESVSRAAAASAEAPRRRAGPRAQTPGWRGAPDGEWRAAIRRGSMAVTVLQCDAGFRAGDISSGERSGSPPSPRSGEGLARGVLFITCAFRSSGAGERVFAAALRPEISPQRFENIHFAPGVGMAAQPQSPKIWYGGHRRPDRLPSAACRARPRVASAVGPLPTQSPGAQFQERFFSHDLKPGFNPLKNRGPDIKPALNGAKASSATATPSAPSPSRSPQRRRLAQAARAPCRAPSPQCCKALTIASVIFLASPNSISVLSRKKSSFSMPA
jgi:hypothetical protein